MHALRLRYLVVVTCCAGTLHSIRSTVVARAEGDERLPLAAITEGQDVPTGLTVVLGTPAPKELDALLAGRHAMLYFCVPDAAAAERLRGKLVERADYGERIVVASYGGRRIPLIDGTANRVVVLRGAGPGEPEVGRILAPGGVAWIPSASGVRRVERDRPETIDEWTHFLHDPSGNPVAHDTVVAPPRHLQWLGNPRWSRHHDRMASTSAMVSSGGRIYYIVDQGSRLSIQLPSHWELVARDAFNGSILWKVPIERWHTQLWPLKSGPTQLTRRLVASPRYVFATLGIEAPVTVLDAATGRVVRTLEQTRSTEEILHDEGTLFVVATRDREPLTRFRPVNNVGDQRLVRETWHWDESPRVVMAVDVATGKTRWQRETPVALLSLTVAGDTVLYYDGTHLVALDRADGTPRWKVPASRRKFFTMNFGPRIVVHDGVVLYAGGDGKMTAYDLAGGKSLWSAPHVRAAYESPEDLFVIRGLVWTAPTRGTGDSGIFVGRDVHTGEIKKEFPPDVSTYWFHHRCYMAKATDRFLLPSRTGIEFVDVDRQSWDINHWVRGGCLYGILPCNGLIYTPPHDCACYPESKLCGLNALAPRSDSRDRAAQPSGPRLQRGPAFGQPAPQSSAVATSEPPAWWPTYRGTPDRHAHAARADVKSIEPAWSTRLGGRLSALTAADDRVFVAQIDRHTLWALGAADGRRMWSFTAEGRIDSPPTWHDGRVYFGSADGHVYCLRSSDGALVWRFRAAPTDLRLMSLEQIESVWPVHGSVLVHEGRVYCVAGRSTFLDGGLRFLCLDAATGRLVREVVWDDRDPQSGKSLQSRIQVLNMPVALPDILSTDGSSLFMRSQRIDLDGNRLDLGPVAGDPVLQGAAQRGAGRHLFAPNGFLDDSWFHRSYWVYGKNFAGGHAGYFQAGRFAPSGRLLTVDERYAYGFARKPEYYRWTTVLEHELFAAPKEPPMVDVDATRGPSRIELDKNKTPDPTGRPLIVSATVYAERPSGVVVAHGGTQTGFALLFNAGKPAFLVRRQGKLHRAAATKRAMRRWVHLCGVLEKDGSLKLYVDGKLAAQAASPGPLERNPVEKLQIGVDLRSTVGAYRSPHALAGVIDDVRIDFGTATPQLIKQLADNPAMPLPAAKTVLRFDFADGKVIDRSASRARASAVATRAVQGKRDGALRFKNRTLRGGNSFVERKWKRDLPIFPYAMASTRTSLILAGPADVMDEQATFEQLKQGDPTVQKVLQQQDRILAGKAGARLLVLDKEDGTTLQEVELKELPAWDGLALADGRVFLSTRRGTVAAYRADPRPAR